LIAFVLLIAWACYMIKYVPLPSTASVDASSADAPKEGNTEPAVVADAKPAAESSPAAVPSSPAPVPTSTSTPAAEPVKGKVTNPEVEKMLKENSKWTKVIKWVLIMVIFGSVRYCKDVEREKNKDEMHRALIERLEQYNHNNR